MKTLGDYFNSILKKKFIDSNREIYQIKSITHEVMNVVYENGEETFLPAFQHYKDRKVSWFSRLRRPKCTPRGIKGEGPNHFITSAQNQSRYTDPLEDRRYSDSGGGWEL